MEATGLRSRASVAKALKELAALEVIDYRVTRTERGQVSGLWLQYLGMPEALSPVAVRQIAHQAESERAKLAARIMAIDRELRQLKGQEDADTKKTPERSSLPAGITG
jgi:hypothetical protein